MASSRAKPISPQSPPSAGDWWTHTWEWRGQLTTNLCQRKTQIHKNAIHLLRIPQAATCLYSYPGGPGMDGPNNSTYTWIHWSMPSSPMAGIRTSWITSCRNYRKSRWLTRRPTPQGSRCFSRTPSLITKNRILYSSRCSSPPIK